MTSETHTTIRVTVGVLAALGFIVSIMLSAKSCRQDQLECVKAGRTPAECRTLGN